MMTDAQRARLAHVATLPDGWSNGPGLGPTVGAVRTAARELDRLANVGAGIYPTEKGGVLIKFVEDGKDVSIWCEPDGSIEIITEDVDAP